MAAKKGPGAQNRGRASSHQGVNFLGSPFPPREVARSRTLLRHECPRSLQPGFFSNGNEKVGVGETFEPSSSLLKKSLDPA